MIKILNLVLYNDNEQYNKMYNILNNYYKNFVNIKTYFYKYNNNIKNNIELDGNIINIKGFESNVHGILEKTLITLKYFEKNIDNFDYIIRSNISSIINFDLLSEELEKNPILYYGGTCVMILQWLDYDSCIINNKYFNTFFCSGTNIILSKTGYKILIDNIDRIDRTIIDDVAIGALFKDLNINATLIGNNDKLIHVPVLNNINEINNLIEKKFIVYRNKNDIDRNIDVKQMKELTDILSEKYLQNK